MNSRAPRSRVPSTDVAVSIRSCTQVERRLTVTADPAPGGRRSDEYGFGLLNPFRAVTETLSARPPTPVPTVMRTDDPAAIALQARRAEAEDRSLVIGVAGLALALLAAVTVGVIRRGRRRGWRPAGPNP